MTFTVFLILVWIHFVSDFVLQSSNIARNKSTDNKLLLTHCVIYSLPFMLFGWKFVLVTLMLHFVVDWCTSRGTTYLWHTQEDKHWFFVLVGFDQALHLTSLLLTYNWLAI